MLLRKPYSAFFVCCFLFLLMSLGAHSQVIKGKVLDTNTGEPLVGATVKLNGTKFTSLVKLDGTFSFSKIPAGTYTFTITYAGYKKPSDETTVALGANETKTVSIALEPTATELESVTISSASGSDKGARRLEKSADPILN